MSGLESFTENSFSEIMLAGDFRIQNSASLQNKIRRGAVCRGILGSLSGPREVRRKSLLWQSK